MDLSCDEKQPSSATLESPFEWKEVTMKEREDNESDVIELGVAHIETRGNALFGRDDTQTGMKYGVAGISSED